MSKAETIKRRILDDPSIVSTLDILKVISASLLNNDILENPSLTIVTNSGSSWEIESNPEECILILGLNYEGSKNIAIDSSIVLLCNLVGHLYSGRFKSIRQLQNFVMLMFREVQNLA